MSFSPEDHQKKAADHYEQVMLHHSAGKQALARATQAHYSRPSPQIVHDNDRLREKHNIAFKNARKNLGESHKLSKTGVAAAQKKHKAIVQEAKNKGLTGDHALNHIAARHYELAQKHLGQAWKHEDHADGF